MLHTTGTIAKSKGKHSFTFFINHYYHYTLYFHRTLYQPKSSIYREPEVGDDFAEYLLTAGEFDRSKGSKNKKQVRQYQRLAPARGTLPIRSLAGYKSNESNFEKR